MWRRVFVGSLGFSAAPVLRAVPEAGATFLLQQSRSLFVRDHRSLITITKGDLRYPAVLSWKYKSTRPKHLVMSICRPPPKPPLASGEDLLNEDGETETEIDADVTTATVADGLPADTTYNFGRLFLRPKNVAQLLSVLQGWSHEPATITREHTSLRLASTAEASQALSAFRLTGTFTAKKVPRPAGASASSAAVVEDPSEGLPNSSYILDDVRAIELTLTESELVLLTVHLEAALRDIFGIEHAHHYAVQHRALQRQRGALLRRPSFTPATCNDHIDYRGGGGSDSAYASGFRPSRSREGRATFASQRVLSSSGSASSRYRGGRTPGNHQATRRASDRQQPDVEADLTAPFDLDGDVAIVAKRTAATAAAFTIADANRKKEGGFEEVEVDEEVEDDVNADDGEFSVDDSVATGGGGASAAALAPPGAAAPAADTEVGVLDDEEEYEEVEVVEEIEEHENDDSAGTDAKQSGVRDRLGVSPADFGGAAPAAAAVSGAAATAAAGGATSVRQTQRAELEMESETGYTRARLVRGDRCSAMEVDHVGKTLGMDVVQSTKVASLRETTPSGALATGTVSVTSGTFRAEGGGVTGSYRVVQERLETTHSHQGTHEASAAAAVEGGERAAIEEVAANTAGREVEDAEEAPKKASGKLKKKKGSSSRKKRKSRSSKTAVKKAPALDESVSL